MLSLWFKVWVNVSENKASLLGKDRTLAVCLQCPCLESQGLPWASSLPRLMVEAALLLGENSCKVTPMQLFIVSIFKSQVLHSYLIIGT